MTLLAHWKLDDNAASSVVVATVGANGTLVGGDNTNLKRVTGPGVGIPYGMNFNGVDDYVDISAQAFSVADLQAYSVSFWARWAAISNVSSILGDPTSNNSRIRKILATTTRIYNSGSTVSVTFTHQDTTTVWRHYLFARNAGVNQIGCWVDGVFSSSGILGLSGGYAPTRIGFGGGAFNNGEIAWIKLFDSDESANVAALYAEKDGATGEGNVKSAIPYRLHLGAGSFDV
jgi:hypothetical protein